MELDVIETINGEVDFEDRTALNLRTPILIHDTNSFVPYKMYFHKKVIMPAALHSHARLGLTSETWIMFTNYKTVYLSYLRNSYLVWRLGNWILIGISHILEKR